MSFVSELAIFFIIWWTVLFAVLPFGIKNAHEAGSPVQQGNDAGAPVLHGLRWKVIVTTLVALVIHLGVWFLLSNGYLEAANLPFFKSAPSL